MQENIQYHLSLNPKQLYEFLSWSLTHQKRVLVKGSPGVGKTSIISKVANDLGFKLIIMHPILREPVDFKGFPFVVDGQAVFLPYGDLLQIVNATEPTVVFLDDLGQADITVQKALMQIILEGAINEFKVPDCVRFCAATNRITDLAGVSTVIEPLKSRFHSIVELIVGANEWCEWALNNNMPHEIIQFVRFRPAILDEPFKPTREIENSPSPRTLTFVCEMYKDGLPEHLFEPAFAGAIGKGYAIELVNFMKIFKQLPDVPNLLKNPETFKLPSQIDVMYALCGALVKYVTPDYFDNLFSILTGFGNENVAFQVMVVKDLQVKFGAKFITHPQTIKFAEKHYNLFL